MPRQSQPPVRCLADFAGCSIIHFLLYILLLTSDNPIDHWRVLATTTVVGREFSMHSNATREALTHLWIIHNYSLASYLAYAPPCWKDEDGAAAQVLHDVVADQRRMGDRIGTMVIGCDGDLKLGHFPSRFNTLHDLSAQFMWDELQRYQQRTIDAIEKLIPQFPRASIAEALAQECLGVAKAHLDSMREVSEGKPRLSA